MLLVRVMDLTLMRLKGSVDTSKPEISVTQNIPNFALIPRIVREVTVFESSVIVKPFDDVEDEVMFAPETTKK